MSGIRLGIQRPPQILFPFYLISASIFLYEIVYLPKAVSNFHSYPFTNKFLYRTKAISLMIIKVIARLSWKQPTL